MKTLAILVFLILSSTGLCQQLTYLPVDCVDPVEIVYSPDNAFEEGLYEQILSKQSLPENPDSSELAAITMANSPVIIKWDLATMYKQGHYNGTFSFGEIQHALDGFGRYWNIKYVRVTKGGQYHVVQGNYNLGTNVAARTGPNTTIISPTYRFHSIGQCEMVICHENRHTRSQAHHAQDGGLMGPNGGYKILPSDLMYFDKMKWKSGLRPTHEPEWIKKYWTHEVGL